MNMTDFLNLLHNIIFDNKLNKEYYKYIIDSVNDRKDWSDEQKADFIKTFEFNRKIDY